MADWQTQLRDAQFCRMDLNRRQTFLQQNNLMNSLPREFNWRASNTECERELNSERFAQIEAAASASQAQQARQALAAARTAAENASARACRELYQGT